VLPTPARQMWHCRNCDLILVDESALPTPDREKARYLQHHNSIDNAGYVATFDGIRAAVRQHAADFTAPRILDFGCGPAPVLVELLQRDGFDATGYDPFFAPSLDDPARFDIITCVETVEHFAHPRATFEQIATLLQTNGTFIMQTQWHRGAAAMRDWWYARDETHVAFYCAATMSVVADILTAGEFEVLKEGLCCFRRHEG